MAKIKVHEIAKELGKQSKEVIAFLQNKGIEVNTSGYRDRKVCGFPTFEEVERYYQLGGRIITIGTDSHTSDRVGEHVEEVVERLKEIGFEDVSTFTKSVRD